MYVVELFAPDGLWHVAGTFSTERAADTTARAFAERKWKARVRFTTAS